MPAEQRPSEKGSTFSVPPEQQGLQKIDFELSLDLPEGLDLDSLSDELLAVFGRWRLEEGEEILDLADYAHVPDGPGVLLISQRWHFGVHWSGGEPGLFYSTRKNLSGSLSHRISQGFRGLLEKSKRLLAEEEAPREARPRFGDVEIVINDRMRFPNTDASDVEVKPELEGVLKKLYGPSPFQAEREGDPARRLGYRIRAEVPAELTFDSLLARL